jgi:hypothetical protein
MVGWQWDIERQPGLMGIDAPQALGPDGQPIKGKITVAFQPNEAHKFHLLSHWPLHPPPGRQALRHKPYPAADVNERDALLISRPSISGPTTVIARDRWRFARDVNDQPVADDSYVWLDTGFQPGTWYEVTYTTRICPVVGAGLLATRDVVSWLRHDAADVAGPIDNTYGYGISQCGRFLRQYLYDGLNLDEQGRLVFDGLIPHVAGARRGEFNARYAQPSDTNPHGPGGDPPFTSEELLKRQRELGGVPKIFTTNTSSEYWRSDCSLIHTDTAGTHDVEFPPEERSYLIAGHMHGAGLPLVTDATPAGARGANKFNTVDGSTVVRAFLINLDRWVAVGVGPPPSMVPRLADGTAVPRETILQQMANLPGLTLLDAAALPRLRPEYVSYASAVDVDGNEVAGIRLPDLTVPVGTHTGWVPRHPDTGGAGQLVDMMGTTLPFAPTEVERGANGDPRPSIEERYRDRDEYIAEARSAAIQLAAQRLILDEDVELVVQLATQRYDLFAPRLATA